MRSVLISDLPYKNRTQAPVCMTLESEYPIWAGTLTSSRSMSPRRRTQPPRTQSSTSRGSMTKGTWLCTFGCQPWLLREPPLGLLATMAHGVKRRSAKAFPETPLKRSSKRNSSGMSSWMCSTIYDSFSMPDSLWQIQLARTGWNTWKKKRHEKRSAKHLPLLLWSSVPPRMVESIGAWTCTFRKNVCCLEIHFFAILKMTLNILSPMIRPHVFFWDKPTCPWCIRLAHLNSHFVRGFPSHVWWHRRPPTFLTRLIKQVRSVGWSSPIWSICEGRGSIGDHENACFSTATHSGWLWAYGIQPTLFSECKHDVYIHMYIYFLFTYIRIYIYIIYRFTIGTPYNMNMRNHAINHSF